MKRMIGSLAALLILILGGCATGGYWTDRANDACDIVTLDFEEGAGARARVGPFHGGLYAWVDNDYPGFGLRGGNWDTLNASYRNMTIEAICLSLESFDKGSERKKDFEAIGIPLVSWVRWPDGRYCYYTQIEVCAGFFGGPRVGFNPGELVDFFLGFAGIDIFSDDLHGAATAAQSRLDVSQHRTGVPFSRPSDE